MANGTVRFYYWVSREKGAPQFWKCDHRPVAEPAPTAFVNAYENAKAEWFKNRPSPYDTVENLIMRMRSDEDYKSLAAATRSYYEEAFPAIRDEFGEDEIAIFETTEIRREVKAWRNGWKDTPRQADKMIDTLVRLLNFAVDEGDIAAHTIGKIKRLHKSDRAYIIWNEEDITLFKSDASLYLRWVIDIATMTGMRREDLVTIPANADQGTHFEWSTHKSGKRNKIIVPIVGALRAVIDEIKAYKASNKIASTTLLCNSRGQPWTGRGLSASFRKQAKAHGIEKTIHDMRGTAVTHFKAAGLTDDEIADIVGWKKADVEKIIKLYINKETVLRAIVQKVEKERQSNK